MRRPRLAATELLRDSCRVSSGISTNRVKEKTKKGKYESQDMAVFRIEMFGKLARNEISLH